MILDIIIYILGIISTILLGYFVIVKKEAYQDILTFFYLLNILTTLVFSVAFKIEKVDILLNIVIFLMISGLVTILLLIKSKDE